MRLVDVRRRGYAWLGSSSVGLTMFKCQSRYGRQSADQRFVPNVGKHHGAQGLLVFNVTHTTRCCLIRALSVTTAHIPPKHNNFAVVTKM